MYKEVTVLLLSRPLLSLLFSSYKEFIRQTEDLNSMDCYKQLTFRAKHIGYHITKVVYRGYEASRALQNTHDDAVRTRMKLKLDAESEEQELTDHHGVQVEEGKGEDQAVWGCGYGRGYR